MPDPKSKQVVARFRVLGKPAGIAMARDGRAATSTEGKYISVIGYRVAQHHLEDSGDLTHFFVNRRPLKNALPVALSQRAIVE